MGPFFEPRPAGREREAADARRRRLREDALKTGRRTLRDAGRNRRGPCRSRPWTTERSNRSRRARGASSRPHHWNRRPWRARRRSMRRLCLCDGAVSIRAARGAAAARRPRTRGAKFVKVAATAMIQISRSAPGRASRGGIHNSFGGSGGLLVRHGDWCCCWFAVSLRARANPCRLRSFFALLSMGLGEATARGASDCVSCPVSRAHSNLCFRTLDNDSVWHAFAPCSGPRSPGAQKMLCHYAPSSRRLSKARQSTVVGALQGVERAPVRSLPEKIPLGQVHQSD